MKWELSERLKTTPIENFRNALNFDKEMKIVEFIMSGKINFNSLNDKYSGSNRTIYDVSGYELRFNSNNWCDKPIVKVVGAGGEITFMNFRTFEFELNSYVQFRITIPEYQRHYMDDNISPEQILISKFISTYNFNDKNKFNIIQYLFFGLKYNSENNIIVHSEPNIDIFFNRSEIH